MKKIITVFIIFLISSVVFAQANKKSQVTNQEQQEKVYLKTITESTKAIEANPKNETAFINRAKAKYFLKDYSGALTDYDSVIALKPNEYILYLYRGAVYISSEYYTKAIEDFNTVISLNPKYAEGYYYRGIAKIFNAIYWHDTFTMLYESNMSSLNKSREEGLALTSYQQISEIYRKNKIKADTDYYKNKKDGCTDLSKAGELGSADAYKAIQTYCQN